MRATPVSIQISSEDQPRRFGSLVLLYQFLVVDHSASLGQVPSYANMRKRLTAGQEVMINLKSVKATVVQESKQHDQAKFAGTANRKFSTYDITAFNMVSNDRITKARFRARSKMEAKQLFFQYRSDLSSDHIYLQINLSKSPDQAPISNQ
jgi:hypothetical protein